MIISNPRQICKTNFGDTRCALRESDFTSAVALVRSRFPSFPASSNPPLTRILVGMHDYYTGLDMDSFQVVADFALDHGGTRTRGEARKWRNAAAGYAERTRAA